MPSKRILFGGSSALVIVLVLVIGLWTYRERTKSPVPSTIRQSVSFPIYYPDQNKLPRGYTLNLRSFSSPQKGVVLYSVNYSTGNKLTFSVQEQPSDNEIQGFYANYIPLRNQMRTLIGEAQIGAYNNGVSSGHSNLQTIVSLPTDKGAWLIITAPYNINQNQLKQVLNSLKR